MAEDKRLRTEEIAAIANALVVLASPALVMLAAQWNEPERAIAIAATADTSTLSALTARVTQWALATVPIAPFAAVAAWRTHALARTLGPRELWRWRGLAEATLLGALVPAIPLFPLTASRGVAGVRYAMAYVVLGAGTGAAFGLVLTISAAGAVRASRAFRSATMTPTAR